MRVIILLGVLYSGFLNAGIIEVNIVLNIDKTYSLYELKGNDLKLTKYHKVNNTKSVTTLSG